MSRRLYPWVAGGLAVLTALLSVLTLVALRTGGEARLGDVAFLKLAAGYDRRAEPILAPAAPPPMGPRRQAADLSRAAIAQFPYDTSAWLRLAYVDALDHGRLTPQGVAWIRRSYDLVAVDPQVGLWRVRFALAFAQSLPKDVREDVRNEVKAMAVNGSARRDLRQMVTSIQDPVGAVWLALWLKQLEPTVAK